ncbi:hypothetical protein HY989_04995 [Candidatus Micrarchaeota archaeon]|nr:hypothetical protein [Candidatus Micrarchaeota archaeon]
MDRIFGTWYDNRFADAGIKTFLFLIVVYVLVIVYNILGGTPRMQWYDFVKEAVILVTIVAFFSFYYANGAHRKYRQHVALRAQHISRNLKNKPKSKR